LPRACSRRSHSTTPSERTCPPPSRPAVELKKQIPALLKLTNPGSTSVAFKVSVPSIGPHKKIACGATSNTSTALTHSPLQVKTTSPKKYVVRPNTGVVPPGGVAEVSVFHRINSGFVTLHA
jgi:MSP (Major sperm protein) domain